MSRSWMMGAAALALMLPAPAFAVTDEEMAQIRAAVSQLEQRRAEDQARIADLERRLQEAEEKGRTATAAAPAAAPAPTTRQAGSGSGFNPAIGVVLNGTYGRFGKDPAAATVPGFVLGEEAGIGDRGFSLGESEVNFSANIDHLLYGELTVALSRENEVEIEIEEAFIQTTALPYGFTAKAGRFFSGIGYLNNQHAHAWDFVDAPMPYRVMLGNQYRDDGVQLKWLAPTEHFLEFGIEGFRGDRFPATDTNRGNGSWAAYVHTGGDLGLDHSWLAGLSWLRTEAENRETGSDVFSGRGNLGIASLVWKWAPDGNPAERNLKLSAEYLFRRESGTFNGLDYRGDQKGWYAQAVYQFMPRWKAGLRYDQVSASDLDLSVFGGTALDNLGHTSRRWSLLGEYDTSEFGRFRLQYNHDRASPTLNHELFLNYAVSFGAHGAHKF